MDSSLDWTRHIDTPTNALILHPGGFRYHSPLPLPLPLAISVKLPPPLLRELLGIPLVLVEVPVVGALVLLSR